MTIRSLDSRFVISPTRVCFRFERRKHNYSDDSLSNRGPASIDLGHSGVNKNFPIKKLCKSRGSAFHSNFRLVFRTEPHSTISFNIFPL